MPLTSQSDILAAGWLTIADLVVALSSISGYTLAAKHSHGMYVKQVAFSIAN